MFGQIRVVWRITIGAGPMAFSIRTATLLVVQLEPIESESKGEIQPTDIKQEWVTSASQRVASIA